MRDLVCKCACPKRSDTFRDEPGTGFGDGAWDGCVSSIVVQDSSIEVQRVQRFTRFKGSGSMNLVNLYEPYEPCEPVNPEPLNLFEPTAKNLIRHKFVTFGSCDRRRKPIGSRVEEHPLEVHPCVSDFCVHSRCSSRRRRRGRSSIRRPSSARCATPSGAVVPGGQGHAHRRRHRHLRRQDVGRQRQLRVSGGEAGHLRRHRREDRLRARAGRERRRCRSARACASTCRCRSAR